MPKPAAVVAEVAEAAGEAVVGVSPAVAVAGEVAIRGHPEDRVTRVHPVVRATHGPRQEASRVRPADRFHDRAPAVSRVHRPEMSPGPRPVR